MSAQCVSHPDRPGADVCSRCGDFICLECRRFTEVGQLFCPKCNPAERSGKVGQLKTLGVLMIVHGGLLLTMFAVGVFGVGLTGSITREMARDPALADGPLGADGIGAMLYAIYGLIAVIGLVVGALQIAAGVQVMRKRARRLAFVALIAGLASLITVYCAPTGLALSIWGMILLSRPEVTDAFES